MPAQKNVRSQNISIAVVGHTNTGKTTLIRTLMKTSIGEVGDSANVTKKGQSYFFEGLQATFIDTPGFQYASNVMMYLDSLNENPEFKMPQSWQEKMVYDMNAIASIESSDLVLYVASLSVVPDDSYKDEIAIIKKKCSKVVAVINQYKKQLEASDKISVENRVAQWKNMFREHSINDVIVFDAHWDNPVKVKGIYDSILNILDCEEKSRFTEGLKRFNERQSEIRKEACNLLSVFIIEPYQGKPILTIPKAEFNNEHKREIAKEKIADKIDSSFAAFIYNITYLYKVAAENPTTPKEQLGLDFQTDHNWMNRLSMGSGLAAVAAGFFSFSMAVVGAGVVGVLSGGAGIVGGAIAGAQIGASVGAALGSFAVFYEEQDTVNINIEVEQMRTILVKAIALIWGSSNNGYGRGRYLTANEGEQIEKQISIIQPLLGSKINLARADKNTIIKHCEKILDYLENEIE
ncbi:GTPase domain-containing protein [Microcoleus sp. CAWBG640]|uniref:GTPase domain-containing protein n=1 Tax=Microcoleus sp. CAWBG640 TaxID=2841653 RepID=UPI00312B6529